MSVGAYAVECENPDTGKAFMAVGRSGSYRFRGRLGTGLGGSDSLLG